MIIQNMPLSLQSIFMIVRLSGSRGARTVDEVNTTFGSAKTYRILGVQEISGILHHKKTHWSLRREFFIVTS